MTTSMLQTGILTSLSTVSEQNRFFRKEVSGERRGIGFFSTFDEGLTQGVKHALNTANIRCFNGHWAIVQGIEKADYSVATEDTEAQHGGTIRCHLSQRDAPVFATKC